MPMTTTHALLPVAVGLAIAKRPVPWKLIAAASIAAAAPDLDGIFNHLWHLPANSIFAHRGATHSLFAALIAGLLAALFHRCFGVGRLTAGVVIAAAMASHGLLDMMTDGGRPVAYLWPLSSKRLFADWRPIHSAPVHMAHIFSEALARLRSEMFQLILPMFMIALAVRWTRSAMGAARASS